MIMTPNACYLLNPVLSASCFTPVSDISIIFILWKTTLERDENPKAKQKLFCLRCTILLSSGHHTLTTTLKLNLFTLVPWPFPFHIWRTDQLQANQVLSEIRFPSTGHDLLLHKTQGTSDSFFFKAQIFDCFFQYYMSHQTPFYQ